MTETEKSKSLYIECNTGISGDMAVAALIDLGADIESLEKTLNSVKSLNIGEFDIQIRHVVKSGIIACDFNVCLSEENPDHDMHYLYGHEHMSENIEAEYSNIEEHNHSHENIYFHKGEKEGHIHTHLHRSFKDIKKLIEKVDMTDDAKALVLKIFTIIANAEASVHGMNVEEVQFHEVGALDSIIDIIAAAVCYDTIIKKYDLKSTIITHVVDGTGTIRCRHGVIPVPVPAVVKIAEAEKLPLSVTGRKGEFVTPTGAAFAAAVKTAEELPDTFHIIKTGTGAGKRDYVIPGILRAMIIE